MISIDTETTGIDFHHGAKPYLVTLFDGEENLFWEWDVDPFTRQPQIPEGDIAEIGDLLFTDGDRGPGPYILQNPKFDFQALNAIGFWENWDIDSVWEDVRDTLLAGHLLASNQPHDLTSMVLVYLGKNIQPYEDRMEKVVKEAQRLARSKAFIEKHGQWRIAKKGLPDMPSAKEKVWKNDAWLPKAIAKAEGYSEDHPWQTVTSEYANMDSESTYSLYGRMEQIILERGLWKIYETRLKLPRIAYKMEQTGITANGERTDEIHQEYIEEAEKAAKICINIASSFGCELSLPKSGNNKSLRDFCFKTLQLPALKSSEKTGEPSLDKNVLEEYQVTLPARSKQLSFINSLISKRKRDTAINYLEGYKRFWLPFGNVEGYYILHPSLNSTGTDTLRWSSSNPNEQNISKQEGFNLRYAFGPAPGREWWSIDAQNLELRIPSFEAEEEEAMNVFLYPNKPPYYGSYHLVVFDALWQSLFKTHGKAVKNLYESTNYQWTKNGNFAVIYGAQKKRADATYHQEGAYEKVRYRFPKIAALADKQIKLAEERGYVETIPDKSVDPSRGYPILCSRSNWGKILPTVPLNYHIQSTAMWWMGKAMIRVQEYFDENPKCDGRIVMQVHDECVFDFPFAPNKGNLPKVRILQRLMEKGGEDIGVPTPVSIEYHSANWSTGEVVN